MFENVGGKLKAIASVFTFIGITASAILGILAMVNEEEFFAGLFIIAAGSFLSWISSLGLYAFGELVENSTIIATKISRMESYSHKTESSAMPKSIPTKTTTVYGNAQTTVNAKTCPHCGEKVTSNVCVMCGNRNNLFR